jgi:hypothetical protein
VHLLAKFNSNPTKFDSLSINFVFALPMSLVLFF